MLSIPHHNLEAEELLEAAVTLAAPQKNPAGSRPGTFRALSNQSLSNLQSVSPNSIAEPCVDLLRRLEDLEDISRRT